MMVEASLYNGGSGFTGELSIISILFKLDIHLIVTMTRLTS